MTIDIRVVSVPDIFVDNEVINLGRVRQQEGSVLAGASWSVVGVPAHDALLSTLRFVYGLIGEKLHNYIVWLFIGNSAWQPDTRIVRYRKLWGALAARGMEISNTFDKQEVMCESDGKLKFFGVAQLSELSIRSAAKVIFEERCTYLVALPSSTGPGDFLGIGWSGDLVEDSKFINGLAEYDGLLIKRFGEFDDEERGLVAIGRPELVKLLIS
jgi:hypothetical protein